MAKITNIKDLEKISGGGDYFTQWEVDDLLGGFPDGDVFNLYVCTYPNGYVGITNECLETHIRTVRGRDCGGGKIEGYDQPKRRF